MSSTSKLNQTRFVQVCVYEDTNAGGQYVLQAVEAKNVPGGLPHAQNFIWGQPYLPDRGTVCAIPTEAPTSTPVPATPVPATPTFTPTLTPATPTLIETPTEVPIEIPLMPTPTEEIVTPLPTPTDVPPPPPVQLPSEFIHAR